MGILGTSVRRSEDLELLTAGGRYADDVAPPGAAHVAIVRSTTAHGRLTGIDTAAARAVPGVLEVCTAADTDLPVLPADPPVLNQEMSQPVLAGEVVRYVGEPIAAVIAETREAAVDAAAAVHVDIEPLPALVDPEAALADETLLHPSAETNVALKLTFARPLRGEVMAGCEVTVALRSRSQRVVAAPMEVRAASARWDGGRLTYYAGTQAAHVWREQMANCLGLEESEVHVVTPDVGGAFGSKAYPAREDVLLACLARRVDRPLRWLETRSENMVALGHGRGQLHDIELGGTRDGRIQAYRLSVVQDAGAYPRIGAVLPFFTRTMLTGPYRIERARFTSSSVVTTTTPTLAYRGAGQPEAVGALERAVDRYAAEIGMDPAEVRRINLIPADAQPYRTLTRSTYDGGDYTAALDLALRTAGYDQLRAEQRERRSSGTPLQTGIGLSTFVEATGVDARSEFAAIEIDTDGGALVLTGTSPHGQGHKTTWAMLVADRLGIPVERVEVVHGDTDRIPSGGGTGGSRSLQTGGIAVHQAAGLLADRATALAAEHLGGAVEDVVLDTEAGHFHLEGASEQALSWADLAAAVEPGQLRVEHTFEPSGPTYPYGTHLAVVDVDVETGAVRLRRLVAVDDAGRVVNPLLVEGQIHGGLAQGAAQALFEEAGYDAAGAPLNASFADYLIPSAADLPDFESSTIETPSTVNELGVRGVGESGTVGSIAAVHNAVVDAVSHLGVEHIDMPATAERVWAAIEEARVARETGRSGDVG
ncbi:xanthine dehydrogenase family protein molybdopterin-binding subunit [Salinactinospora qingdaonensis]|uniref:Xanthine dehydrogenase family protein molybdopterin-binding subunit n=1 Tax=Salinactinospora qingdaonensis TaxID=702744 RepID=A0ABP7FCR7_9ACTN